MKALRLFTIVSLAVLVISAWAPAPAYAGQLGSSQAGNNLTVNPAAVKLAKLRVNNRSGGTLYISFSGPRGYFFAATNQGKTTFDSVIQPGKYTITVTASACSGKLTYKKTVKGGVVSLPPIICRHK